MRMNTMSYPTNRPHAWTRGLMALLMLCAVLMSGLSANAATPTVTTPTSANVATTTARLGGNVTSDGGAAITERGVVYALTGTNSNPLIGGTGVVKATTTGTTGVFTVLVTGLTQTTGYSFKAYATNSGGTSYSSVATFTTTLPDPTGAAGLVVTTNSDVRANDGAISLRDAVAYANSGNAGATPEITFSVTGIIDTTWPAIPISNNLTITGPGASSLTISGNGNTGLSYNEASIFKITSGIVGISGLTLKDGTCTEVSHFTYNPSNPSASTTTYEHLGGGVYIIGGTVTIADSTISNNTAQEGGGIYVNGGSLELTRSTVSNNNLGTNGNGGGIYLRSGTMAIRDSTISGNIAGYGAGIISNGTMTISNSTISGNIAKNDLVYQGYMVGSATGDGRVPGIVYYAYFSYNGVGGGILNNGTLAITNSTITGNRGHFGGGVYAFSGTLNLLNSIVAGNIVFDYISVQNGYNYRGGGDITGTVNAGDYNLVQNTSTATLSGTHNITGQAANLGTLVNNGGPTLTHSLLGGSPAIDSGDPAFDTTNTPYDQRGAGYARKDGSAIDIGAFELPTPLAITGFWSSPFKVES